MALLSLSLLGGFRVELNGQTVTAFESNKVRALLAYLAVEADRSHPRSAVAGLLWPDQPEDLARTNLRHVLRQLRQTLPDQDVAAPLLMASQHTIQINQANGYTLDVARFDTLLAECERCDHSALETCPDCIARYSQAAALYRGPFLAGLDLYDSELFDEWAVMWREQLHRRALELFFTLAAYHDRNGDYEQARQYAWRQLELEPWREEAHRQVMRMLARSGQRTAALAHFARCRRILADELGVEPDPETLALYEQIRNNELRIENAELRKAPAPHSQFSILNSQFQDWGDAPTATYFYGRQDELETLRQWLLEARCRLVLVMSMGGMGKTTLVARSARMLARHFELVFWRSLLNAPPPADFLRDSLRFLARQQPAHLPESFDEQAALLFDYLRQNRCLLVLDNLETILETGRAGHYRPGYEAYGRLIDRMAQAEHRSCMVLTSRERPQGVERLEEDTELLRVLHLKGLDDSAGQALLMSRGLTAGADLAGTVMQRYSGNPLALKLVARTIQELFDGDIAAFLGDETLIFDDIRTVLDQQFGRLSPLEREILLWLAIEREAVSLEALMDDFVRAPTRRDLLEALRALQRRSLLEKTNVGFTLQNVVMEYATDFVVEQCCLDIEQGRIDLLNRHALVKAQAKEYVRQSQERLVLAPIANRLIVSLGQRKLEARVHSVLDTLRSTAPGTRGYAAGNLLNFLLHLGVPLRDYDFSRLAVWQATLRGKSLVGVDFSGADLSGSTFSDTFGVVRAVAFSPDGQRLAAGTSDGEIRQWQASDHQPLAVVKGHARPVNAVVFRATGDLFASSSDDCTLRMWDAAGGRARYTLQGHTGWVRSTAFSPDGRTLASASSDHTVRLWDVASGTVRRILSEHSAPVWCVAFNPDGTLLASGGADHTVRVWDTHTGRCHYILHGHTGSVVAVTFSPDGKALASSSADRTIRLWDVGTEKSLVLSGHEGDVRCLAFSPNGQVLASGSADCTMRMWEIHGPQRGGIRHTLYGHVKGVNAVAFSPDGATLVSGSDDHTIRIWNADTGQPRDTLHGHTGWVRVVDFSPDGALVASGSDDTVARLWDAHTGQLHQDLHGHHHWIWSMAFSPNGELLATGGADHLLCLWNVHTGRLLHMLHQHTDTVRALAFDPDGSWLATGCADHRVRLWDPCAGQLLHTLEGHIGMVQSLAFSPDGSLLASASDDQTVRLWNIGELSERKQTLHILRGHTNTVWFVRFSPDGALLASASEDHTARLWDVQTGKLLQVLEGHDKEINCLAFSPDGRLLATGSADHTARLWDVSRGRPHAILRGHSAWIRTVVFHPDGKTLATGGADHAIYVWDVDTGQVRHVLREHSHWIWSISFSPNGNLLASGSVDESVKLWDAGTGSCRFTLRPPGPYAGMNITGVTGITDAQKAAIEALGAVEIVG